MIRVQLPVPEEFSFELNFDFLRRSPKEPLHKADENSVVKLLRAGHEQFLIAIKPHEQALTVEFLYGTPDEKALSQILIYVTEWFDLKTDLKPFYAMAAKDRLLKGLVEKYYGYRIMGQPDLFESLVWAVLGQQINVSFAYTLKQRFVEQFGEKMIWNNDEYFLFPHAQVVAQLKDEHLLPLQFSRQKSLYIIKIAEAFATGTLSKEKMAGMPLAQAKEQLMKIKGIGNWTANYALMKTFHYPDAFPLEDAGVHNAIKKLKKLDNKPTLEEVKKVYKKYKGWEAYATLYLWKSL